MWTLYVIETKRTLRQSLLFCLALGLAIHFWQTDLGIRAASLAVAVFILAYYQGLQSFSPENWSKTWPFYLTLPRSNAALGGTFVLARFSGLVLSTVFLPLALPEVTALLFEEMGVLTPLLFLVLPFLFGVALGLDPIEVELLRFLGVGIPLILVSVLLGLEKFWMTRRHGAEAANTVAPGMEPVYRLLGGFETMPTSLAFRGFWLSMGMGALIVLICLGFRERIFSLARRAWIARGVLVAMLVLWIGFGDILAMTVVSRLTLRSDTVQGRLETNALSEDGQRWLTATSPASGWEAFDVHLFATKSGHSLGTSLAPGARLFEWSPETKQFLFIAESMSLARRLGIRSEGSRLRYIDADGHSGDLGPAEAFAIRRGEIQVYTRPEDSQSSHLPRDSSRPE